jgi:hypothetical protein
MSLKLRISILNGKNFQKILGRILSIFFKTAEANANRGTNTLAEAEAKSPFLGQTEAEVDHSKFQF